MKQKLSNLWGKDGTKSVLASLISILIGMVVGVIIIAFGSFIQFFDGHFAQKVLKYKQEKE